ncbi:polysaccharide pyruvyl transferase family protein [Kocuria tytonis]|uniref:Uncharacterized protein n=1 Tax=Kocuria tytonis TaxID=2054280 RepID=A0A495A8P7_9MICC|nr:polysaccharide pyruvyl transferase family protein [Kocuria tytonis]RKQ36416.1 hypothetical protein C1C97_001705 [Kocuria tytonis]
MQTIDQLKAELEKKTFDQGFHWRILFLGRSINGTTDIVSSMSRSLRNLGHHVLDLDIKYHRIAENPDRVSGGNGPIYVQAEKLQGAIDGFRPQMIICCAGGLTFTEEDAQRLKDQGIVLVGITLSDPDVFPTVHAHAHVFDVHTTNAGLSLRMYEEAGVRNTVYFPFGIDRGFVTQHVDEDPSMAADVICVGHANDRPDRNQTMVALNSAFDVKTYGRGWEIPDSETVAGDKALQAMKMGKIHINFPLTRAGFINIKCGVFESVGAGAVIATGEFDEMSHFFDYGDEIIGYSDDADLARKLQVLLDDPQEYERVRLNGFRRLVNNHLYEHRWMELFARLRDASSETMPWLDENRTREIAQSLTPSLPRARAVILSGFYGAGNLGDELILQSISSALQAADPAVDVVVAAENPYKVEVEHGLQAFKRSDLFEAAHQLHTADAVVVGGGGLWHDLTFQRAGGLTSLVSGVAMSIAGFGNLPMMGRVLGIPYHVIGLGAGPLEDPDAQAMVKFLAEQTESILLRDPESQEVVERAGVPAQRLSTAPDVVYAVDLPSSHPQGALVDRLQELKDSGHRLVGVNLRRWSLFPMDQVLASVEKTLNSLAAAEKIAVVCLPMQAGTSHDRQILQQLAKGLSPNIPVVQVPDPLGLSALDFCLSELDLLVTMRLHAALLAHRRHVPTVGLVYDSKVRRHFEEVGREHLALPLDVSWEQLFDSASEGLSERQITDENFLRRVDDLQKRSSHALGAAARRVAEAPVRAVVYEIPMERPAQPTAEAAAVSRVAAFTKADYSAKELELPQRQLNVLFDAPRALHISLPTTAPVAGQEIHNTCTLRVDTTRPVEVSLTLVSNYERAQNQGRISTVLRIGDHVITDDLARSKEPVMIRVRTSGSLEIPVGLSLVVNNKCFPAQSWPKYSRVSVRVNEIHEISDRGAVPALFASAGSIAPHEDDEETASTSQTSVPSRA